MEWSFWEFLTLGSWVYGLGTIFGLQMLSDSRSARLETGSTLQFKDRDACKRYGGLLVDGQVERAKDFQSKSSSKAKMFSRLRQQACS